jgi:hypothetical protein
MKYLSRGSLLVLCWAAASTAAVSGEEPWEKTNQTGDGITIYVRAASRPGIKEYRATITMDARPRNVWQAVMDRDTYRESNKNVVVDKVFRTANENVWYNYQLVAVPLMSRRDYTLRYEIFKDPGTMRYRLVWAIANEQGPAREEGVIRLALCDGSVTIEPQESGKKALVTYWVLLDPGGSVPAWAANAANRASVPDFLRKLRDQSYLYRDGKKNDKIGSARRASS